MCHIAGAIRPTGSAPQCFDVVYRPDRRQHSAALTARLANGGQQSQLAVDGLPVAPD